MQNASFISKTEKLDKKKKHNMDYAAIFLESLGTLKLNKMRTFLAILGIVIGIGSVSRFFLSGRQHRQ